jgi:NhaP-type Na+/H+ or K+/H+ antiporter
LAPLQARDVVLVVGFLLVVRPVLGWLGMLGTGTGPRERAVIAFFGVRGIGSLFYISWALQHGDFAQPERLWAVVGFTVAASVLLHGVTATPAMLLLDRQRHRAAVRRHGDASRAPETAV